MQEIIKKAKTVYKGQRRRCQHPRAKSYVNYGAKGISVEYTMQQFVDWYVAKVLENPIPLRDICCGRIDHSKNYSLDNIQIESKFMSISESANRNKPWLKRKQTGRRIAVCHKDGTVIKEFESIRACALAMGYHHDWVGAVTRGHRPYPKSMTISFKYL